jgi:hypothetical protein
MNNFVTPVSIIHNSGILLQLLRQTKEIDFSELQSLSGLDDLHFYMAIGHLITESKASFSNKNNSLQIRLT